MLSGQHCENNLDVLLHPGGVKYSVSPAPPSSVRAQNRASTIKKNTRVKNLVACSLIIVTANLRLSPIYKACFFEKLILWLGRIFVKFVLELLVKIFLKDKFTPVCAGPCPS